MFPSTGQPPLQAHNFHLPLLTHNITIITTAIITTIISHVAIYPYILQWHKPRRRKLCCNIS
jgi:hypothetical protein